MNEDDAWIRQQDSIAQFALTNSKNPYAHVFGVAPKFVQKANGCHLEDLSGRKYIDYICGMGTNLVGYGNETINKHILEYLPYGVSHSLPTTSEFECAEKLKELFPYVDAFKFLKTGTEACMAAVKIARTVTKRWVVVSEGYHGWSDMFVGLTPPAKGVCKDPHMVDFNNLTPVMNMSNVAAIIVEPVMVDDDKPRIQFLQEIRRMCDVNGIMLIFDEIITGMRYEQYSVAQRYGIYPDLVCLGKGIANGFPLAAVGGKYASMNTDYFVSGTYFGDVLSLQACIKTCDIMQKNFKYDIKDLWLKGGVFLELFNNLHPDVKIAGYNTRGIFVGNANTIALFFQESAKANILFGKSWFFNFPLIKYTEETIHVCKYIFEKIDRGEVELEGEMPINPLSLKWRKL